MWLVEMAGELLALYSVVAGMFCAALFAGTVLIYTAGVVARRTIEP
jgi:hypothetical protein